MATRAAKKPTCIHQVEQALIARDDFTSAAQLVQQTGLSMNQVSASLYSLQNYEAADCVESPHGLWWFATPEHDTRIRHVEERTPEEQPRKPRRSTIRKVSGT